MSRPRGYETERRKRETNVKFPMNYSRIQVQSCFEINDFCAILTRHFLGLVVVLEPSQLPEIARMHFQTN